ncbi:hypothetical protein BDQ17DRAFT_904953 [Cyathus striatus]|nr:hypothetical protein BDQ17DRAFT_904953 [Cyathus striatus]
MCFLKLPFLASTIWGTYSTFTAPQKDGRPNRSISEVRLSHFMGPIIKTVLLSPMLLEIFQILLPNALPIPAPSGITTSLLLGSLINLIGVLLRIMCFNTLGRFFTFEVGLHKDHELITSGPYKVVRHPSYTGVLLIYIGCLFVLYSCAWIPTFGWAAVLGVICLSISIAFRRVVVEDEMLKKEFGAEWGDGRNKCGIDLYHGYIKQYPTHLLNVVALLYVRICYI